MSVDLGFETIGNATSTVFDNSIPEFIIIFFKNNYF